MDHYYIIQPRQYFLNTLTASVTRKKKNMNKTLNKQANSLNKYPPPNTGY